MGIGTLTHLSQVNLQFLSISSSLRIQNRVRGKMREEVEFQGILRRPHLPPAPGYAGEALNSEREDTIPERLSDPSCWLDKTQD